MPAEHLGVVRPRAIPVLAAMCCLLLGGWLSWHHPLAPTLTVLAFLLWSTAVFLRPNMWLMIVPALLPIVDLAPWTGWLIVEEFDLLVLGAGAGAYASMAWQVTGHGGFAMTSRVGPVVRTDGHAPLLPAEGGRLSAAPTILIVCLASGLRGLCRGFSAAGWTELDWFDGYYAASNSLRVAKSYLLMLLMLPPLIVEMRRSGATQQALYRLGWSPDSFSHRWRSSGSALHFRDCSTFPATTGQQRCSGKCMSVGRRSMASWR